MDSLTRQSSVCAVHLTEEGVGLLVRGKDQLDAELVEREVPCSVREARSYAKARPGAWLPSFLDRLRVANE